MSIIITFENNFEVKTENNYYGKLFLHIIKFI